jgi:hypothetical protein
MDGFQERQYIASIAIEQFSKSVLLSFVDAKTPPVVQITFCVACSGCCISEPSKRRRLCGEAAQANFHPEMGFSRSVSALLDHRHCKILLVEVIAPKQVPCPLAITVISSNRLSDGSGLCSVVAFGGFVAYGTVCAMRDSLAQGSGIKLCAECPMSLIERTWVVPSRNGCLSCQRYGPTCQRRQMAAPIRSARARCAAIVKYKKH